MIALYVLAGIYACVWIWFLATKPLNNAYGECYVKDKIIPLIKGFPPVFGRFFMAIRTHVFIASITLKIIFFPVISVVAFVATFTTIIFGNLRRVWGEFKPQPITDNPSRKDKGETSYPAGTRESKKEFEKSQDMRPVHNVPPILEKDSKNKELKSQGEK